MRGFPNDARGFDQVLAWQAAAIDTRSAQRPHFSHGGGLAQFRRADCRGKGGGA